MRASLLLVLAALGLLHSPAVRAQSIRWDPPGGSIAVGQTISLQLVCEDCEPKDTPLPPKVDGLSLSYAGQASNMSFINGTYSHSISYTYATLLTKNAPIEIPAFDVETNKGRVRVPAARFDPGTATVGNTGQPLESAANSRLEANPPNVWAGEVFDLAYSIEASRSYAPDFGRGVPDWNPEPLVIEDWSRPEPFESRSNGEPQTGYTYRTRAIASKPGNYQLKPVNQLVNLSVGVSGFGFFQQRQYQQFSVTSTTPTISVRPLPPAPAGFTGAVGDFKLVSKVVPERAAVGDPVTWTLELSGIGNWPSISGLPRRLVSKDFQVIQPQAKRTPSEGKLFTTKLTEDVVLVPTRAGTYQLQPVRFISFNPKTGSYETLTAPGATITVTAAPIPAAANSPPGGQESPLGAALRAAAPPPPSGIPNDPLPDASPAWCPLGSGTVVWLVLAPFVALGGFWLWLARQRAQETDPARFRREARRRLEVTLAEIRRAQAASSPSLPALLLAWQQDASKLWGLAHAAPSAAALDDPAWTSLWSEADRSLYGSNAPLPGDWVSRAGQALASKPVPAFSSATLFRPRNLFPFLALALILTAASSALADGASSYRRGDFPAAEKAWRAAIAREPTAWAARHNLSLALAQQNHWDEAAAQATAAFVQAPGNSAVQRQFALACDKAGFVPEPLADFLSPGPIAHLARLASPPVWQILLGVAAGLAAVALGALIASSYRGRRRVRTPALAVLILALGLFLAAEAGWQAYGTAARAQAVVVWRNSTLRSIPSEADTAQKTAPLAAGSVARVDKNFLGWVRLAFDNGQTGWVRKDELVWLWR